MNFRSLLATILVLFSLLVQSQPALTAEYIFRDLMGNTIPATKCAAKDAAETRATDAYTVDNFRKRFCEVQGYGWNLVAEKTPGKLICNECEDAANQGKFQCHLEDIVVTCKRLKPGSVGLFPGEG
jgi:hypothetical protein